MKATKPDTINYLVYLDGATTKCIVNEFTGILARNYKKCSEALVHRLTIYLQDSVVERPRSGTTLEF
ncbi:MAG: hypothetical protein ACRD8W_18970 [Nitrososphaeraceae archaeon]